MSIQFTKTQEVIRQELPGDENKDLRHQLHTLIHSFHVNKVPAGTTIQNFPYIRPVDAVSLQKIADSLESERYGCKNLAALVSEILFDKDLNDQSFTLHDITRESRDRVNASALALLDDRPQEDVVIIDGAAPALTQRIEHSEVKAIVEQMIIDGRVKLNKSFDKSIGAFRYSFRDSLMVTVPQNSVQATKTDSLLARIWGGNG